MFYTISKRNSIVCDIHVCLYILYIRPSSRNAFAVPVCLVMKLLLSSLREFNHVDSGCPGLMSLPLIVAVLPAWNMPSRGNLLEFLLPCLDHGFCYSNLLHDFRVCWDGWFLCVYSFCVLMHSRSSQYKMQNEIELNRVYIVSWTWEIGLCRHMCTGSRESS